MRYDIKYMDSALVDMAVIKEYLPQYHESTWVKVARDVEHHIGFLRDIPHGFPLFPGSDSYRKLVAGDYIVLYKVVEESLTVQVHAIWHREMNILEHIRQLPK
ncbi:MAG: type II toxin-antitoxin system RelE/ParE family toxin [Oscillospiraceae bacterium]|nr:type II toxin-antitoxin system RelE/ParE family toxin [Oscillospiraceae bacterium]